MFVYFSFAILAELTDDFSRTGAVPKRQQQHARKVRGGRHRAGKGDCMRGARNISCAALTLFMFMSRLLPEQLLWRRERADRSGGDPACCSAVGT